MSYNLKSGRNTGVLSLFTSIMFPPEDGFVGTKLLT